MRALHSLHARDEGSGEPVLLMHGLMASQRVFDGVISRGKAGHRFLAVDLPRSGRSGAWSSMAPTEIAAALVEWLESRGVRRAVVVGHSYGGLVALALAEHHPQVVSRMVVASAPALGLPTGSRDLFAHPVAEQLAGMIGKLPTARPILKNYLKLFLSGHPEAFNDAWVDGYLETLRAEGAWPAMLEAVRHVAAYRLPTDLLRARALNLKVIWGDRDRLVPLLQGEHLATALKAPFTVLHKTGHLVPEEQPDALLEAIDSH